jgi:diamine N-acetyltransferase
MEIILQEITAENFVQAIQLKVKKDQEGFVASNAASIAQSKFVTFLQCYGIYDGDEMVGFSVFGRNPDDGEIWIARHMIGEQFQGKGYGKSGLQALIRFLADKYQCRSIFLDVSPENYTAISLYEGAGFKDTGRIQGQSKVYQLTLEYKQ